MSRWFEAKYQGYGVAYLAFHGRRNRIVLGDGEEVTLEQIADVIDGRAAGKILYFGSCSTLAMTDQRLKAFCARTGAKAVVGYTRNVGWLEAAAFDFILLPKLLAASSIRPIFTALRRDHPRFVTGLGFRMAPRRGAPTGLSPLGRTHNLAVPHWVPRPRGPRLKVEKTRPVCAALPLGQAVSERRQCSTSQRRTASGS